MRVRTGCECGADCECGARCEWVREVHSGRAHTPRAAVTTL
jgi:hypothetical protein